MFEVLSQAARSGGVLLAGTENVVAIAVATKQSQAAETMVPALPVRGGRPTQEA